MKHLPFWPVAIVLCATTAHAQTQPDLTDTWQGTLHAGKDLRTVVKIAKAPTGAYKANFYSIDQGAGSIPIASLTLQGVTVKMDVSAIGGTYEGKLSPDGKTITGEWKQGPSPLPLILTRATPETAWAIPEPPPKLPPMAADANPSFDVATIKPSKPETRGMGFRTQGQRFSTINTSLVDLITFAYSIHQKQLTGAPAWMTEDKYDIQATPDQPGQPSGAQLKSMMQKLLADRFQLKFHHEKKELSVYVLTVVKTGKIEKGDDNFNGLPGLYFTKPGAMNIRNATLAEFTTVMQEAVLDRPVVDQTGLSSRFNFTLNWTPDDSQFNGMAGRIPPPAADSGEQPPDLFTAIQAQAGLKLEATKAPADVFVIDHVEKPSAN